MPDKTKVLVIDDDPAICVSVKAILEASGYETATALSGKEGLELFRRLNPDIVLCDMMMEDIDAGAKVAKVIKEERPELPVFLLSTIGEATARTIGLDELGFNGVFQKPVNFDLLLSVLEKHRKKA
ncbi:MAG: response regulator [Candidatus Saccharicenans sp.]|jgi:CheY-like chemotaxis protein|uniref:Two-component response regulator n=1 Tax=Candidatus Saccharicenans subterraneus TaxID=2508984 RepID=A0A3E2BQT9_9BACT|nr:response regulator [Candidatus Saccharicenans sp.]MCX8160986.1 response regulator [Candidatus Saccharicenans sp.]MDH7574821.1 response regulator [Candidatus Saccharicenans sp.]RFT17007.1 MAG: Two-component response regulator [Candidatus Saccharicenans subterraneum]